MKFCPHCEKEYSDGVEVCSDDGMRLVSLKVHEETLTGTIIDDRYLVEEKIGEGGMGSVYLATQKPIQRKVALKVLRRDLTSDDSAVKRFFHEAKIVSTLRHPNTITMYDFGQSKDGLLYIAMEYMSGESLDRFVKSHDISLIDILDIIAQICESLAEAHQIGIIHRDLKPENIFLDRVGSQNIVKVLDFGIAKVQGVQTNLTLTGMVFGTPAYMSPEQSQGFTLDQRSDIYALGVLLFELVSGRLPYLGDSAMKVAMAHILEPIPNPIDYSLYQRLPLQLSALIISMMAKEVDDRPDTTEAVLSHIKDIKLRLTDLPRQPFSHNDELEDQEAPISIRDSNLVPSQRIAVKQRTGDQDQLKHATDPKATGPQRTSDLFTTADYSQFATLEYKDSDTIDARIITPEMVTAQQNKKVYVAVLILVFISAALLLLLFGPRPRDDHRAAPASAPNEASLPEDRWDSPLDPETTPVNENNRDSEVYPFNQLDQQNRPAEPIPNDTDQRLSERQELHQTSDRTSNQPPEPEAPEAQVAANNPELVTVTFTSQPGGVRIRRSDNQETLCHMASHETSCSAQLTLENREIPVEINRRHYRRERIAFTPNQNQEIELLLRRSSDRDDDASPFEPFDSDTVPNSTNSAPVPQLIPTITINPR